MTSSPIAEDQHREQQGETVEPEREVEAEPGDPGPAHRDRLAGEHRGRGGEHDPERGRGHHGERPRRRPPRAPAGDRGERGAGDEWQTDRQRQREIGRDHGLMCSPSE